MTNAKYYHEFPKSIKVGKWTVTSTDIDLYIENDGEVLIYSEVAANLCFDLLNVLPAKAWTDLVINRRRYIPDVPNRMARETTKAVLCGMLIETGGHCRLPRGHRGFCSPTLERKS